MWKKSKLNTWQFGGFRIVEYPENELQFTLHSPYSDPVSLATFEQAKAMAELQNRLALAEEDNARLRAELEQKQGKWPADDEPVTLHDGEAPVRDPWFDGDQRGVPRIALNGTH